MKEEAFILLWLTTNLVICTGEVNNLLVYCCLSYRNLKPCCIARASREKFCAFGHLVYQKMGRYVQVEPVHCFVLLYFKHSFHKTDVNPLFSSRKQKLDLHEYMWN